MDLSQRRTFAVGATLATVVGLSVGIAATRDAPQRLPIDTPPARLPTRARSPHAQTLATHVQEQQPAQNCVLPDVSPMAMVAATPRQSAQIQLSHDQRSAAVADSDNDTVVLLAIDGANAAVTHRIATGEGPTQVLLSRDGRAFVTERRSATVSVYDARTGRKLCTQRVAQDPYAMALSADGQTLLVTSGSSAKLTAFDTRTMQTKWLADTAREPRSVAFTRNGARAVLTHIAGKPLSVLDVSGERPRVVDIGEPAVPTETQRIAATTAIDSDRTSLGRGSSIALPPHDHIVGLGRIAPEPPSLTATQVRPVPSQAWSLAAMVESDDVVVPFMVNRTGRELPPLLRVDRYGGGSVSEQRQNEKVTFALGVFDTNTLQWKRFEMPNGVRRLVRGRQIATVTAMQNAVRIPMATAVDPRSGSIVVASLGTSELATIALSPSSERGGNAAPTAESSRRFRGHHFSGIQTIGTVNPPGISAQHEDTLPQPSGVAITSDGVTLVYSQFEHAVEVRKDTVRNRVSIGQERLPPDVARGRRLFYTANNPALTSGGLSCGGCHPDGRDDGLVWFLANGPRQTPTLAGRLVAPFNWTGSHRTIEGNVAQTITRLGGTGLPISDVDAIAAYVQRGIDAPAAEPPSAPPSPELVARGRDVFMGSGNCASCHDPARNFTDGQPHELGGLGSDERERLFDTPSLRFVRATGPFFHDGRYQTLRALLTDATARMGNIGSLTLPDVDALEAFLLTL